MDAFYPPLFNTQTFCLTLNGRMDVQKFTFSEEFITFWLGHIRKSQLHFPKDIFPYFQVFKCFCVRKATVDIA